MDTTTFPRTKNGYTDTGEQMAHTAGQTCPNCGGPNYTQTVSTEHCPDCGLHCDYWGDGTNDVYKGMTARRNAAEQEADFRRSISQSIDTENY